MVKQKREAVKPPVPTGIRFPADLLRQVEAFAAAKGKETGIPVNRTDAVLYLVRRGLAGEGSKV